MRKSIKVIRSISFSHTNNCIFSSNLPIAYIKMQHCDIVMGEAKRDSGGLLPWVLPDSFVLEQTFCFADFLVCMIYMYMNYDTYNIYLCVYFSLY